MAKVILQDSNKGFKYGMIVLGLIIVLVILTQLLNYAYYTFISLCIGILTFGIGILALVGFLKGFKDQNKVKKIIGLIVNLTVLGLFILIIVANASDVYQALYN